MGRTFNRSPISVNTPSSSDIKQYYFNHYNWKGINQNKNFLLVDQETFADALNVYADDKSLLKSRPALKFAYEWSEREIVDVKVFDDLFVIGYKENSLNRLAFFNDEGTILYNSDSLNIDFPIKCFRSKSVVYIFTNDSILQYDIISNNLFNADMYNPITRVYTGNKYVEYESENLFSNYSKYRYILFPSIISDKDVENGGYVSDSISSNAYGKTITYSHKINEETITHNVYIDSENRFLGKIHQTLSYDSNNFHTTNVYNVEVPTYFIKDNFIYRFNDGKIEKASTSTMIFETIFVEAYFDKVNFVKIKPQDAGYITIIYKDGIRRIDYDGKETSNTIANLLYIEYYIDVSEIKMPDGKVIQIGVGFNTIHDESGSITGQYAIATLYNKNKDSYEVLRLSMSHSNIFSGIKCYGEIDINYNEKSYEICQGFSLSYMSDVSYFSDIVYCKSSNITASDIVSIYGNTELKPFDDYFSRNYYLYVEKDSTNYPNIAKNKLLNTIKIKSDEYKTITTASLLVNDSHIGSSQTEYNVLYYGDISVVDGNLNTNYTSVASSNYKFYYNDEMYAFRNGGFYYENDETLITNLEGIPLFNSYSNYWLYLVPSKNVVLSNYRCDSINTDALIEKDNKYSGIDILFKDSEIYVSKNNELFIGDTVIDESEDESLYFRAVDKNIFDTNINGIWKISDNLIALFFNDYTKYCSKSDGAYYFTDSKIVPRLKGKSSLITLKDSTTTLMPSDDGIYSLSYQDFINTTEQATKNLSEDIVDIYSLFKSDIQIINYKNYTIFYENQNKNILIFDLRYSAWWRWEIPVNITNIFFHNSNLFVIGDGKIYKFVETSENYFDYVNNNKIKIDWYIKSQKLHLNANNYYKHIYNITLCSVDDNSTIAMRLDVNNYRKYVDNGKAETFKYFIDVLRTFVKRLNYSKVCEFQYSLASDTKEGGNAINFPLSLSNITIKYDIGGQVR